MGRIRQLIRKALGIEKVREYLESRETREKGINIAVITIDSLRYDIAMQTDTPNFKKLFHFVNEEGWHKVFSHGTYTLASHISIFQAGILPSTKDVSEAPIYNRDKMNFFRAILKWNRNHPALYPTPEAENIVKGFEKLGYRTIGIGGVNWFNTKFKTSRFWKDNFFSEFYWEEKFQERSFNSFEYQIELTEKLLKSRSEKNIFYFLNISSTHFPYRREDEERSLMAQSEALQYIDQHILKLINLIPKPCHFVILSDHGECFGENGLWGHGFYHPKIMEVPMIHFLLRENINI